MLTMCCPDEIVDYGGIDGVMSPNDYDEELLRMVISQLDPDSARSYFRVLAVRDDEDAPLALDDDAIMDDVIVDFASPYILGHVVGESNVVEPPLSFDVFSGFVSRSDDVLAFSSMDLSIFEYSLISFIDDIDTCAPQSPTSQMMSLCSLILMIAIGLTPIIALLMSEFHLLLITLRQLTLVQQTNLER